MDMQEELNQFVTNGVLSRNKARLVEQGYNQQEGIDFDETYAPVARLESIRILLVYACANDSKLFQMDVKSAFLKDVTRWCDDNGNMLEFSVRNVWEALRDHGNEVPWHRLVWFPHWIPLHAFNLWLIMRESLKTQDKVQQWDIGNNDLNLLCCPLSCTSERVEVYYECKEPFKSLMHLWVRNNSIAAIWLEKVVTPLIEPAIKGFAAAPAVLKSERLKVDKTQYE
nr:retrovirus-related Pol polyprotein from transposon TNT 1-94 [Tanacetum cinerariifolium]